MSELMSVDVNLHLATRRDCMIGIWLDHYLSYGLQLLLHLSRREQYIQSAMHDDKLLLMLELLYL